jgi:hypothetical protein
MSQPDGPPGRWSKGWRAMVADIQAAERAAAIAAGTPPPPVHRPPPPPDRRHRADIRRFGLDPHTMAVVQAELEARALARRRARAGPGSPADGQADEIEHDQSSQSLRPRSGASSV